MKVQVASLEEFLAWAQNFALALTPSGSGAAVIALGGDLGAGKTTFTQALAKALGVQEPVTSPTFVIEKRYKLAGQKWKQLYHIDAYRLRDYHEMVSMAWEEIVHDRDNLIVVEWPERVAEVIPEDAIRLHFDIHNDGRIITIDGHKNS